MSADTRASEFFVAGGTLRPDAPSYVERPADGELFNRALAGEFCYVLTPRQMGKSSLMIRTARRLQKREVKTVIIDLTRIGADVSVEQWYLSLLTQIKRKLRLSVDPLAWWHERAALGRVQRFTDFMRDVILTEIEEKVVIFIDEIDSTLSLDFRDDFFAAIRAIYNARAEDPVFDRLTFVLLGVASPPDLIKDRARTPFNIGYGIMLQEFSQADAAVLRDGLEVAHPGQGKAIFIHIYRWTKGHPYLTQKLCLTAAGIKDEHWNSERVDELAEKLFLSEEARKEANLKFVQDKILTHPQRSEMLKLYKKVVRGKRVGDDGQSPVQNQLKLSGLVKVDAGYLRIRNEIYHRAFSLDWIQVNTPVDWSRRIGVMAIFALILAFMLAVYARQQGQQANDAVLAQNCEDHFINTTNPILRLDDLFCLFDLQGYGDQGHTLFNSLTLDDKMALFTEATPDLQPQVTKVVRETYTYLDNTEDDTRLLGAMQSALNQSAETDSKTLADEITHWLEGRDWANQKNYSRAILLYSEAIGLNSENPATRFERALALAAIQDYESAADDFRAVLSLSKDREEKVGEAIVTDSRLHAALWQEKETHPTLMALASTPTSTPTDTPSPTSTHTPTSTTLPTPSWTSTPTKTATPTSTDTPTPTETHAPTPTETPSPTPAPTSMPRSYHPPVLEPVSIIGCNVAFRWTWFRTLAEDEYFSVRVGRVGIDPRPGDVTWTKEVEYTYTLNDAGEYNWEIAICQGDPSSNSCLQLAVSERDVFGFGGCSVSAPTLGPPTPPP